MPTAWLDSCDSLGSSRLLRSCCVLKHTFLRLRLCQVVCSAGVAAAAGQPHGSSCLLSAPVPDDLQQYARVQWASLITKHVCLDIMVPDTPEAVQQLGG